MHLSPKPLPKIGGHSAAFGGLVTGRWLRTRTGVEDSVDGVGVYAGRLRPTSSARHHQSSKVLDRKHGPSVQGDIQSDVNLRGD